MDIDAVQEGMKVRDRDGERLGKVARRLDGRFIVEKGFLWPREITARLDQVAEIRRGVIWLSETGAQLEAASYRSPVTQPGR